MAETAALISDISTIEFPEAVLASTLPVIVDFWAAWCGPCRRLSPVLEELAEEFKDRASFVKVNADAESALAHSFGIRSLPSLIFFKNGHPRELIAGMRSKQELRQWIDFHLAV